MLNALQKQLLEAAAQRSIEHPGSIQNIFFAAASVGDEDTVMYIYANYFTAQHFEPQAMQHIQQVFMYEVSGQVLH